MTAVALLWLVGCTRLPWAREGAYAGECSDGADNDQDGFYDCKDPDCAGAPACAPQLPPAAAIAPPAPPPAAPPAPPAAPSTPVIDPEREDAATPGVRVRHDVGDPYATESDGTGLADRLSGPCDLFVVLYRVSAQSGTANMGPFNVAKGQVHYLAGQPSRATHLSFTPDATEAVILHNAKAQLVSANCAGVMSQGR